MILSAILSSFDRHAPNPAAPKVVADGMSFLALTPILGFLCCDDACYWIENCSRLQIARGTFDEMLSYANAMINNDKQTEILTQEQFDF